MKLSFDDWWTRYKESGLNYPGRCNGTIEELERNLAKDVWEAALAAAGSEPTLPSREQIAKALAEQHRYAAMNHRDQVDDRCTACWRQERDPIHGEPADAVLALLQSQPTQVTEEMVDRAQDAYEDAIVNHRVEGPVERTPLIRAALEAALAAAGSEQRDASGDYRKARGVLAHLDDGAPAEESIRRGRGGQPPALPSREEIAEKLAGEAYFRDEGDMWSQCTSRVRARYLAQADAVLALFRAPIDPERCRCGLKREKHDDPASFVAPSEVKPLCGICKDEGYRTDGTLGNACPCSCSKGIELEKHLRHIGWHRRAECKSA